MKNIKRLTKKLIQKEISFRLAYFLPIFCILLISCLYLLSDKQSTLPKDNFELKTIDLSTCVPKSKKCVNLRKVFNDLDDDYLSHVGNVAFIPKKGLLSITHSQLYKNKADGKYYAFFLTQLNEQDLYDGEYKLSTCHACSATLGVTIYVFKDDKWSLLTSSLKIANIGSWGKSFSGTVVKGGKDFDVKFLMDNIFLLFRSGYMGQGIHTETLHIFKTTTKTNSEVNKINEIQVVSGNCSGKADLPPDWKVKDIDLLTGSGSLIFKKEYSEACRSKSHIGKSNTIQYWYDMKKGKFRLNDY